MVEIDLTSAGKSNTGIVFAGLFLRVGERPFPEASWTDNVVVVLSWWTRSAGRALPEGRSCDGSVRRPPPQAAEDARFVAQVRGSEGAQPRATYAAATKSYTFASASSMRDGSPPT